MDKQGQVILLASVMRIASDLTDEFGTPNIEYLRAITEMTVDVANLILSYDD